MYGTLRTLPAQVVAIATSAGGLPALKSVLSGLPATFPGSVLILQHRAIATPDHLAHLLAARSALPVRTAQTGLALEGGEVLVAPTGRHLEVTANGLCHTERTHRVNYCCPAADLLFSSVARYAGPRAVACVLTGMGADGAAGVKAIRAAGGFVIAQSPRSAAFPDMPQAAIETRKVDLVLPLHAIAFALTRLAMPAEEAA